MKLGIFTTHPIQYHVPLWKQLFKNEKLDSKVFYFSDHSIRGDIDPGFGQPVKWDLPLLQGYSFEFITKNADLSNSAKIIIPNLYDLLQKEKFDWILILGYTYGFERQIIKAKTRFNYKICIRGEFSNIPANNNPFIRVGRYIYLYWFYKHIDSFCYIGKEAYQHLIKFNINQNKLFFSPYAADNELLRSQIEKIKPEECRQKLGIKEKDTVILFSGKLIQRKNPLLLVEALRRLDSLESIVVIMIGDGQLKEKVERELRYLLGEKLIMPGFVNQTSLGYYFSAADIFVLPSVYETWGLVINEAMQYGLPVIVSDKVGCKKDLVIPVESGYVFHNNNAVELSQMIRKLIRDRNLRETMGSKAKKLISDYTIQNAAKGILKAIEINE